MTQSVEISAIKRLLLMAGMTVATAVMAPPAIAGDPAAGLAQAEQKVSRYEDELSQLQDAVAAAEVRYRHAVGNVTPALRTLQQGKAEARRLRHRLAVQEQQGETSIARLKERHQEEVKNHDEEVRSGVGFGLAALVTGLIALTWSFFRASAPVAALTELDTGRTIGLCVGIGLLILIVGLVLGSLTGALGALGSFLALFGLILPIALLLARHSAEVQRGRAKPWLGRERLPSWVPLATAAAMAVIFLASTGSAIFAGDANSEAISPQLEQEAEAASEGRGAEELEAAQEEVAQAKRQAAAPLARRNSAQRQLVAARGELNRVKDRLAAARSSQHSFTQRLVALEAREEREAEREEARRQHEEEQLAAEVEEEEGAPQEEESAGCNSNYNPCLPYASDYDCEGGSGDGPAYTGTVEVVGYDEYGLDDDGDGIGCE